MSKKKPTPRAAARPPKAAPAAREATPPAIAEQPLPQMRGMYRLAARPKLGWPLATILVSVDYRCALTSLIEEATLILTFALKEDIRLRLTFYFRGVEQVALPPLGVAGLEIPRLIIENVAHRDAGKLEWKVTDGSAGGLLFFARDAELINLCLEG